MNREEFTKYFGDYFQKCKNYNFDQIYNEVNKDEKYPFFLQFIQLKEYYNFKKDFIDNLNSGNLPKKKEKEENQVNEIKIGDKENQCIIQNEYCLIDKKWIENWKKYVGYDEVINNINNNNKIKLNDYHWIKSIISKNSNKYPITSPNKFFKENKINSDENFEIINEKCYKNFNLKSDIRYFPMRFQKEKNILIINDRSFYIIFKEKKSQKYFEILINFDEVSEEKKQLLDIFYGKDFNEFINIAKFNLYQDVDKCLNLYNCKIHIFNQTLKFMKEISVPNIKQNGEILKKNLLSQESLDLINNETSKQIQLSSVFKNINDIENKDNENLQKINEENYQNNDDNLNNNTMVQLEQHLSNISKKNNESNNNNNINNNNNYNNVYNNIDTNLNNNNLNNNYNNNYNNNLNNNNFISYNNNINNNNVINNINNNNNNNFVINNNNQMNNNMINQNFISNNNLSVNNNFISNQQNNNNGANNFNNNNYNNNNYNNNMPNVSNFLQQNMNVQNQNINSNFQNNQIFPIKIIPNNIKNNNFKNKMPPLNIKYPHKTGLTNLLQTCYMNATIQCLSNIKDLTDYLLRRLGQLDVNKQPLTTQYTNLLSGLFYTKEKYVDPSLFKKVIGELNPLFQGLLAGDSKDLLFYILEAIHNELSPEQKNVNNIKKDFYQLELESRDEQKMLKNFYDDFKSRNQTKIYDIFYGITRSTMKCNHCNITKFSFQMFNMQIFLLKKIKEDKMTELGKYYNSNDKLNILDAFLNQQKEEKLVQENMIYCNNCKGLYEGVHQQVIYGLPKVLIIILNRGRDNMDFNEEFNFPDILDLKDTGVVLLNQNSYHKYYLCGILTHFGDSGNQGHFAAYCRNSSTDTFTFYNDTAVTQSISIESAMKTVISDDSCKKKTPYILFYNSFE